MFRKFVIRNLLKRPFLNLIKVIGLSLALCCILLIVLFLKNELTYDSFHTNSSRIYRLTTTSSSLFSDKHFARIPTAGFIPILTETFPEIENYVRLAPIRGGMMKLNEEFIEVDQAFQCDSTFFEVFDAELLVGNPESILSHPGSMVISKSFAEKIFGKENPIGEILTLPSGQFYGEHVDFTILGIMKDFPQNSHFHPELITSPVDGSILNGWAWSYVLLHENTDPAKILLGFGDFYTTQRGENAGEIEISAHLQVITDIHLHSNKLREIESNNTMSVVYTLSLAALILLLIALINYANLSIGMAGFSDKYFLISQLSGATSWMKLKHYLSEGMIIVLATFAGGGVLAIAVRNLIQKQLSVDLFTGNVPLILSIAGLFGLLSILSGILPMLARINKIGLKRKGISKSLIVLQYSISIALIVAVLIIQRQTNFALKSGVGVEDENLICIDHVHTDVQRKFELFKEELQKQNSVQSVSAMFEPPGGEANDLFRFTLEGYLPDENDNMDDMIGVFPCDYSFASIFNLRFLSGDNFSENYVDNQGSGEYIINSSALRKLKYANPDEIIGKEFSLIFHTADISIPAGKIIGVVEDFHLSSIKKEIEPLVLFKRKDLWLMNFVVSFKPGIQAEAITDIESVWKKLFPEFPFQYAYVSSMYQQVYKTELLQAKLLSIFTLIALFICSMGLLGMSLLTTQRRVKEIAVRKVIGATIPEILILINWGFLKWILMSYIIAIPIAYFAMNRWLENFAYKASFPWWIFALAGLVAIFIALVTVSVQSWKAAGSNPVEGLRYE